jgi:hypothetical protein
LSRLTPKQLDDDDSRHSQSRQKVKTSCRASSLIPRFCLLLILRSRSGFLDLQLIITPSGRRQKSHGRAETHILGKEQKKPQNPIEQSQVIVAPWKFFFAFEDDKMFFNSE